MRHGYEGGVGSTTGGGAGLRGRLSKAGRLGDRNSFQPRKARIYTETDNRADWERGFSVSQTQGIQDVANPPWVTHVTYRTVSFCTGFLVQMVYRVVWYGGSLWSMNLVVFHCYPCRVRGRSLRWRLLSKPCTRTACSSRQLNCFRSRSTEGEPSPGKPARPPPSCVAASPPRRGVPAGRSDQISGRRCRCG